jgi:hypothetical protein
MRSRTSGRHGVENYVQVDARKFAGDRIAQSGQDHVLVIRIPFHMDQDRFRRTSTPRQGAWKSLGCNKGRNYPCSDPINRRQKLRDDPADTDIMIKSAIKKSERLEILNIHQLAAGQTQSEQVAREARICDQNVAVGDHLLHFRNRHCGKGHFIEEETVSSMFVAERNRRHLEPEIAVKNAADMVGHIGPTIRYVGADYKGAAGPCGHRGRDFNG